MLVTVHLAILFLTVFGILLSDHDGYLWLRGKKATLDPKRIARYHWWVSVGLLGMVISGFFLFWPMRDYLLTQSPQFIIKMIFVGILIVNAFAIGELSRTATEKPFSSLTQKEKIPFLVSGALSGVCWIGAALSGFFLF